jgi:stage II sporulation protein D
LRSAISSPYTQRFWRGAALALVIALVFAGGAGAASTFSIRGGGNGHGIGLSQYGAYGYALHGKDYRWILGHYYRGTSLGRVDPRNTVRVLLATGPSGFAGADRAVGTTGRGAVKLRPGTTYRARPEADGRVVLVDPSGKRVGRFIAPVTVAGPGALSLAGVGTYRGALELRPDGSSGIETVNAVGVDDYVRGVISAEMPSGWAAQALRAQAVAARTYALTTDVGGEGFGLYADTRSQMYRGVAAETPSTDAAVLATRGQVVTFGGAPVVTYFSASSGGHTEDVQNVWPGAKPEPWLRGVVDRYDGAGGDPYHRWSQQLSMAAAARKLGSLVKGRLVGIEVTRRGASPRVLAAEVIGTKGRTKVSGAELQRVFDLLTTYASFTTISTSPGRAAAPHVRGATPAHVLATLVPVFRGLVVAGFHGTVFPPDNRAAVVVQRRGRHGWRTVAHVRVRRGAYDTALPGPGTYRIVYRGIDGPVIRVP